MRILTLSTERTVASCREAIGSANADWVVFVHATADRFEPLPRYFALLPEEADYEIGPDQDAAAPVFRVIETGVDWQSGATYGGQPFADPGERGPAATRVVVLSPTRMVIGVEKTRHLTSKFRAEDSFPEGDTREVGASPKVRVAPPHRSAAPEARATLFAGMPPTIALGIAAVVEYRIEGLQAGPALGMEVSVVLGEPIQVRVSTDHPDARFEGPQQHSVVMDSAASVVRGEFRLVARSAGVIRVAVNFGQNAGPLGAILLASHVVDHARSDAAPLVQSAIVQPPPAEPDDQLLTLLIEERSDNGSLYFDYTLQSPGLRLNYVRKRSGAILTRDGGPGTTLASYIRDVYDRATVELRTVKDAQALQREARGLGVSLSKQLLEPEVVEALWPHRDRIGAIHIVSFEPRVPWELVRMQHPVTGDVDDRYFAEYALTRSMSGVTPPRRLLLDRWSYLQAVFPTGSHAGLDADREFFEEVLPARGLQPSRVANTADALFNTVANDGWDVLHLSCHATSDPSEINRARLIIGEEISANGVSAIAVNSDTLQAEARLKPRQPLVFLNACETGLVDVVLTSYGGWPKVFCDAGAGVFVGTSWSVREKPAAAFAATFYRHLLGGARLSAAAAAARQATKAMGDISWLAYKVYGDPLARADTVRWPLESG